MSKLEADQKNNSYASSGALESHTGNPAVHVTAADKNNWNTTGSSLSSHTGNSTIHVTAAEKETWSNGAGFAIGSYQGDGTTSQKITLGYKPQFGMIFASGDGIARVSWTNQQLQTLCGCMSRLGCSLGITLNSDGFSVDHSPMGGMDGFSMKFNNSGVTYVYFIWK